MVNKGIYTRLIISFAIALVATLSMIGSLFMPQITANDDVMHVIEQRSGESVDGFVGIKAEDMQDISVAEMAFLFGMAKEQGDSGVIAAGITFAAIFVVMGIFLLLNLLFSLIKKPIPLIIFNILAFGVFCLQNWIYRASGIIDIGYGWGTGYRVYIVGSIVLFISSIWMLINRVQLKNAKEAVRYNQ